MKVKMLTTAVGPEGNYFSGSVYDLPQRFAVLLVEGGYAEALEKPRGRPRKAPEAEQAVTPAPAEKAVVKPKPKRRTRRPKKA